jgi:tetratricopeptide (TPR) repeat protein
VTVRPTSAVQKYAGGESNAVVAGQALGVESVLEGSIRRSGERIRVTVQLVSVRDGSPLWAEKFDEKLTDMLSLQEAVAERVSQSLALRLSGEERRLLTKRYTNDTEAHQHYLKGRYFLNKRTEAGYQKCIEHFQWAITLDQSYAPAYAGLADAYNMTGLYVFTFSPPREIYPKAREAAREALRIDGDLGEAHTALAYTKLNYDWDWPEVERAYQRAIELKPDDGNLQHWYSHYRMSGGRTEESLVASRRALALDPLDLTLNAHLGWHYLHARQYEQAVEQLLKTIELDPNYVTARLYLGFVYEQQGKNEAAIAEFGKAVALSGEGRRPVMEAALGHAYAVAGKRAEAQRILDKLKAVTERRYTSPYSIAVIHAGLGNKEQAYAWLDQAYAERDNWLIYLKVEPRLDPLRSDARFAELLRRIGLTQ